MGLRGIHALHRVLYYGRAMLSLRGQPRDSGSRYLLYVPCAAPPIEPAAASGPEMAPLASSDLWPRRRHVTVPLLGDFGGSRCFAGAEGAVGGCLERAVFNF